ncbi:MAG: tyrosine-protein phosphatase [Lentisphaerae bacterium]|nr:tyrosine-protein phosphatase [Lentisphaerota bacterium]
MLTITLLSPAVDEIVHQLSQRHKAYLVMPREERIAYFADEECRLEMQSAGQVPQKINFSWHCDLKSAAYTLEIDLSSDFNAPIVVKTKYQFAAVDNLFIAKTYFWRVTAVANGQTVVSSVGTFITDSTPPRLLRIDGVDNVRDLGGWPTIDDARVRQGLVYRTGHLNNCAAHDIFTADELRNDPSKADSYEPKRAADERLISTVKFLEGLLEDYSDENLLPYLLNDTWTAFRPDKELYEATDHESLLDSTTTIPDTFLGATAESVATDQNGTFIFDTTILDAPALLMQEFEAPHNGFMMLGGGADWYWNLRINGQKIFDKLASNDASPVSATNYYIVVPVKKGRNLITAQVLSGSTSWTWCCAAAPDFDGRAVLVRMIDHATEARNNLWRVIRHPVTNEKVIAIGIARIDELSHLIKGVICGSKLITEEGQRYMLEDLGIRSDVELRREFECRGMTGSPLGDSVRWFFCPSDAYAAMQSESGREGFTKLFRFLLDTSNYPLFFHCAAGQDRTGAVAFILNGLLGVAVEDLYLDWEVTGFWNKNPGFNHELRFNHLVDGFEQHPGETLHDKIKYYVLSLGFTEEEIEAYRHFMLEK